MSRLDLGDERDIGVVGMQFVEPEHAPAQFVVAKERREIAREPRRSSRRKPRRDVVAKERGFERGGIIARARAKDIRLYRIGERRGERELVILKLIVELVERAFPQMRDRA